MYLWDVKGKTFNWKHLRLSFLLEEFGLWDVGLGVNFYHHSGASLRYGHYAALSITLLWLHLNVYADWGRKAETDAMIRRWRAEAPVTRRT